MKKACSFLAILLIALATQKSSAATVTIAPLNSWGGGDGWLAPGEGGYAYLGTADNERGLAYGNGHVYLVSTSGGNNVRILDQFTGADLGALDVNGVDGGTRPINMAAVGPFGAIYVGNLTTNSSTIPFKVYRWANEAAPVTVGYSGAAGLPGARVGDTMSLTDVDRLALGYGNNPALAGSNSYAVINVGINMVKTVTFPGMPPNSGDFGLGLTFTNGRDVLGTQGGGLYRWTTHIGSGTLFASPAIPDPAGASDDILLGYSAQTGAPLLAVQNVGDARISIYNVHDQGTPVYIASANNTSGPLATNGNRTGQLAWGAVTQISGGVGGGTFKQVLYAMSTNQGIQAFEITVTPEPSSLVAMAVAGVALVRAGRSRATTGK